MKEKINKLNNQTQITMQRGAQIYNSLRNSFVMSYGKIMTLEEKRCLAMYLGLIQSDNFFSEILNKLKYNRYIDYELVEASSNKYDEEFYKGFSSIGTEDYLEIITLYLISRPIIQDLNEKIGYSERKLKLEIYDWMGKKIQNTEKTTVKAQKVLTNLK